MIIRHKISVVGACALLLSPSWASAQERPSGPLRDSDEPLEKYDQPPALLRRIEYSPAMISRFDVFTSYQVNVAAGGLNIVGDAANEPSICMDPTNPNKMSIGWRQFNTVSSNFRQGGWGYTTNGGTSWTFPGVLQNNVFRSDPVLDSDATGRFFYLSLIAGFSDDIWRSTNGGQNWTYIAPATGGDKQWFVVDKSNSSGYGFHYQYWSTMGNNYGGRQFTRSTNNGATWLDPIFIPNSPIWGTLDTDSDGTLFIGGINVSTDQTWCIRSRDARNGGAPTFDLSTPVSLGGTVNYTPGINPAGLGGQIFLAADRSGTSTNNNVYMLASVRVTGASTGNDVMFVRSTDGGATFSDPKRINDDPVNVFKWHWFGTFAVAPNGRLDCVWLDTRNASNNTDSQLFYSYSLDGGLNWASNIQVSNSFNPFVGYPQQNKLGDYITMVSDNTGGNVAYAATFNGEEDVYYVRVAPPAPAAQSAVSRKVHGAAGTFDINMPLAGPAGVECRSGGPTNDYELVVTFPASVDVAGNPQAQITAGSGTIGTGGVSNGGMVSVNGSNVTIPLTNVANAQTLNVTLNAVNRSGNVMIPMSVLVGDANGNRAVNATDVALTKSQSGNAVNAANFRSDLRANGAINATDTGLAKSNVGTGLP